MNDQCWNLALHCPAGDPVWDELWNLPKADVWNTITVSHEVLFDQAVWGLLDKFWEQIGERQFVKKCVEATK
jgi:hypothetical protein